MPTTTSSLMRVPLEWYRQMRATNPVAYDPRFQGWNVFRYEDALHVLTDHATFSSSPHGISQQPKMPSLLSLDPPRHRQLRNIVTQAFTPRMVARLEPRITEVTNRLLDNIIPNGEMEVIQDLAYPLPITIIAELLGIPADEQATFRRWSEGFVSGPRDISQHRPQERLASLQGLNAFFAQLLEERRRQPREDLMSRLITAE